MAGQNQPAYQSTLLQPSSVLVSALRRFDEPGGSGGSSRDIPHCMRRGDVGTCNVVLSTSTPRSQKEILSSPGKHSTLQVPILLCVCKNAAWQISRQRQDEASVEHNAQALTPMSQDAFCCGVLRYSAMQGCSWPDVEDTASSQPSKDVLESEVRGEP